MYDFESDFDYEVLNTTEKAQPISSEDYDDWVIFDEDLIDD